MAIVRRSVIVAATVLFHVLPCVSVARADHCHRPPLDPGSTTGQIEREAAVRIEARSLFATFETERYQGSYEGLSWAAGWSDQRFRAEASIPIYRLLRNGRIEQGWGDALLALAVTAWSSGAWRMGFEAAITLPFGEPDAELGMGHVMLLPSAWGAHDLGGTRLSARLGYATALSETADHHADGMSPLVAPMNAHELTGALFVDQRVLPAMGIQVGADLAVPTGQGQSRSIVSAGVLFDAGAFDSTVQLEHPLLGEPFEARVSGALAVAW